MKKIILVIILLLLSMVSICQVSYDNPYVIKEIFNFEPEFNDRLISISNSEITISKFIENTKTQYLIVNKIVDKDWGIFDGVCKTYYCTTKDADFINGYQKVIIYIKDDMMKMAMFADEVTVFHYQFKLNK